MFLILFSFAIVFVFCSCKHQDVADSETKEDAIIENGSSTSTLSETSEPTQHLKEKVDSIFNEYLNEKFIEDHETRVKYGWTMELPSGKHILRDDLIRQTEPLVALGHDALPYIINWIGNEYQYIQYIAKSSMFQLMQLENN